MKYFGTDGIRDRANQGMMTADMALKTGRAFGFWLKQNNPDDAPLGVVLGQDTRVSGDMLASAVAAGVASSGVHIYLTKIMSTPGIAYLTKTLKFDGGVVISASHNPYYDNGIKLFKAGGYKLNDDDEIAIEALIDADTDTKVISDPGIVNLLPAPDKIYSDYIVSLFDPTVFSNLQVVLDCANGAASFMAKNIFAALGIKTIILNDMPNGTNINNDCGSEHVAQLTRTVVNMEADAGFAFDGDADRVIAVDSQGNGISGDRIIAVLAKLMQAKGLLKNDLVVTTVMSNLGFKHALAQMGLQHSATQVGDRYVLQEMLAKDAVLGGEDSGHIVFLDAQTTGDGILSALRLLEAMTYFNKSLGELALVMDIFPQKLINVDVSRKPDLMTVPEISAAIAAAEAKLGGQGRVLIRYSGTQPMCRVMVEGADADEVDVLCRQLAQVVESALN